MVRSRRGVGDTIALIGKIVIILITVGILLWIFQDNIYKMISPLVDCDGACTYKCGEGGAGAWMEGAWLRPTGNNWCQESYWNIQGTDYETKADNTDRGTFYKAKQKTLEKNPGDWPKKVLGSLLGLKCCSPNTEPESWPNYYLTDAQRVEEKKPGRSTRNDIINPPRIIAYFGDAEEPLTSGNTVNLISGRDYTLALSVTNVKLSGKDFNLDPVPKEEPKSLQCKSWFVDEDGTQYTMHEMCDIFTTIDSKGNAKTGTSYKELSFDSTFEGKTISLVITLTPKGAKYNPYGTYDVRFEINFKIYNPIKASGLTNAYTREKTISLGCDGIECIAYAVQLLTPQQAANMDTAKCDLFGNKEKIESEKEIQETIKGNSQAWEAVVREGSNQGLFELKPEIVFPNEQHISGEKGYLCYYAISKDRQIYKKFSSVPVRIDNYLGHVSADFKALQLLTEATCNDGTEGSGCTGIFGYHYISEMRPFFGALFGGIKNAESWCPQTRSAYTFVPSTEQDGTRYKANIPYNSPMDFMIMCVWAEDNAGNYDQDIVITYNAYDAVLAAIDNEAANQAGGMMRG